MRKKAEDGREKDIIMPSSCQACTNEGRDREKKKTKMVEATIN